jgi:hypothetical protein
MMENHVAGKSAEDTYDAAIDAVIQDPALTRIYNYGTIVK